MHLNSELLFQEYALPFFRDGMRVLEIGPDRPSTYQRLVRNPLIRWETLDLEDTGGTYVTRNECEFPIGTGTFDIVCSGQVIEHVRKPWVWIREVARVCKEGGFVVTINPINWEYHEAPIDCWRIYPEGLYALYEEANLEMLLCRQAGFDSTPHVCSETGVSGRKGLKSERTTRPIDAISIGMKPRRAIIPKDKPHTYDVICFRPSL